MKRILIKLYCVTLKYAPFAHLVLCTTSSLRTGRVYCSLRWICCFSVRRLHGLECLGGWIKVWIEVNLGRLARFFCILLWAFGEGEEFGEGKWFLLCILIMSWILLHLLHFELIDSIFNGFALLTPNQYLYKALNSDQNSNFHLHFHHFNFDDFKVYKT